MMSGNPFPQNAWLTYAEATARWGNPTSPKQVEYILATTEALSAHPAVRALVAEAEARGMDRAAGIAWDEEDETVNRTWENWGEHRNMVTAQTVHKEIAAAIRAEAAAIRREATK